MTAKLLLGRFEGVKIASTFSWKYKNSLPQKQRGGLYIVYIPPQS